MRILKNFGKRIKPLTPVRVIWEDATSFSGWKDQVDRRVRPTKIETVSLFFEENNQSIHLVRSIDEYEVPQIGDHLIIPNGCVISVEKLK